MKLFTVEEANALLPSVREILHNFTEEMSELDTLGVQLKDFERGLVDFPSLREGRVVLLCWQLGEGDELEWWHDVDTGFSGRTPL